MTNRNKQAATLFAVGGPAYVICGKGYRGQLIESLNCSKKTLSDGSLQVVAIESSGKKLQVKYKDRNGHEAVRTVCTKMFTHQPNNSEQSNAENLSGESAMVGLVIA